MQETARRYREHAAKLMAEADKIDPPNGAPPALYVKWGMHHLLAINECMEKLNRFSNLNMMDAQNSLFEAKKRLIFEKPEYQEAAWRLEAGEEPEPYDSAEQTESNVGDLMDGITFMMVDIETDGSFAFPGFGRFPG